MEMELCKPQYMKIHFCRSITSGTNERLRLRLAGLPPGTPLRVVVDAVGGVWPEALDVYTTLKEYAGPVAVELHKAESAGFFLLLAADTVFASDDAISILREPDLYEAVPGFDAQLDFWTLGDVEALAKEVRGVIQRAARIVADEMGLSAKDARRMMAQEAWFDGNEIQTMLASTKAADDEDGGQQEKANATG